MHLPLISYRTQGRWAFYLQPSHAALFHASRITVCQIKMEQREGYKDFSAYESLLKKCDSFSALLDGMCIHDQVCRDGLDDYVPINNLLLQMYGKCDALVMVSGMFLQMRRRDSFSWNFLIRAYTRQGRMNDAFLFFYRMQEESVIPTKNVYSSLLSSSSGAETMLLDVLRVHVHIAGSGSLGDVFVGTGLINVYGARGNLEAATGTFLQMSEHDSITWNTMIKAYNEQGFAGRALDLYDKMLREGTLPTSVTFVSILNACKDMMAIRKGKRIHVYILLSEHDEDVVVGTALMHMYGTCGDLRNVRRIFDSIYDRDIVLLNAVIATHVQNKDNKFPLDSFHRMWQEGMLPDKFTFASILSACANENSRKEGKRIHALISASGFGLETMVGNATVSMYGKCGSILDAQSSFSEIQCRDTVSWNAMISAYGQNGETILASAVYEQMHQEGVIANGATFISMLEHLSGTQKCQTKGKQLHACLFSTGFVSDIAVGNALISMYASSEKLNEAQSVLHSLPKKDKSSFINFLSGCSSLAAVKEGHGIHTLVVFLGFESDLSLGTALLTMYSKCGSLGDAWALFKTMTEQDVVSWTAMIAACTNNGQAKEALDLYEEMQSNGLEADKITLVSILDACIGQGALAEGRRVHKLIIIGSFEPDIVVGTALLNMYGKCGVLEDAHRVFDNLQQRDTIAWTIMIATYAQHGYAKQSIKLFNQMRKAGIVPNEITFISVLNACSHSGLVDEGRQWFASMKACGITPGTDHYNCMIDLLTRAGMMEEAETLINEMPVTPGSVSWTTLLGACKDQPDAYQGERAAGNMLEIDPVNVPLYVTLSNIYSACSRGSESIHIS